MNAIECRDLTKAYRGFTLDHLTFSLPAGCILGLVGENGAGKSTTLKLLMNAISRDEGQVSLLGVDNQSPEFLQTKQDIGVVLDEACLPEVITPRETGKLMALTYTRWDQGLYEQYLARFALPKDKKFKELSRGMKMKLAIAAALSHGAKLLLLDEATSALDEETEHRFLKNLKALQNVTCIIVSHKKAALRICNKHVRIEDCKIVSEERTYDAD